MLTIRSLRPFLAVFGFSALAFAQDVGSIREAFGVHTAGGEVRAGGPGYSARFDARGVEFVPLLGRRAEQPMPARFTLQSVRRDGANGFVRSLDAEPTVDGNRVSYAHGDGLTEVYDARADGVEQSFVFASRPAGSGDLVVRGAIATELPFAGSSDDGVRYALPGVGGVTFGAVTGVDANGASARGSIRAASDGTHVEWVLPAAFVDHAAYPLVLDPLIGAAFQVGDAPGVDLHPAVAFDQSTSRYLVAWTVVVSASVSEIRGQIVTASGTLLGPLFTIWPAAHPDCGPVVASCNAMNRFLVVWRTYNQQGSPLLCAVVNPAGVAQVSPATQITISGGNWAFAAGGDVRVVGDKCLIAYDDWVVSGRALKVVLAQIPATGAPTLSVPLPIVYGEVGAVSVSETAGVAGRWLVSWSEESTVPGAFQDIGCATVSEAGTMCSSAVKVFDGGAAADVGAVDCATIDGSQFVVAWQDDVLGKVRARPVTQAGLCPGTLTLGATVDPILAPGTQTSPAIDFATSKYVLTWTQSVAGTGLRTFVKGLDPVTCATCGVEHALETSASPQDQPAIASRWSGGDTTNDQVLVVWSNGTIRGRRFEAMGADVVTSMGGACSVSGLSDFATYNGDCVIGNADFSLELGAPVSLPLVVIVGFSSISVPCGSCTIVPALDILFPATNPLPLPIPCDPLLVGADLYTQWLLLKPSDCAILPDFAFSNALRFTVGE